MDRREFVKLIPAVAIAPVVLAQPDDWPVKPAGCGFPNLDTLTQHNGVYFTAIRDTSPPVIKWEMLTLKRLCYPRRADKTTIDVVDTFDFWQHDCGELYWVGKHTRWVMSFVPGLPETLRISLCGYRNG